MLLQNLILHKLLLKSCKILLIVAFILMKKEELLEYLQGQSLEGRELFITLGAGDIDRLVGPIGKLLTEKYDR